MSALLQYGRQFLTRNRGMLVAFAGLLLVTLFLVPACGGSFDALSKINSVRVIGVRSDKPYARPGEAVTVEALAYDGRADQSEPMQFAWLPFVCINPIQDLYFACFLPLSDGSGGPSRQTPVAILDPNEVADGGAGASDDGTPSGATGTLPASLNELLTRIPPGFDLTPFLPKGPKFAFRMPSDIIETHAPIEGVSERYGIAFTFFVACAGKIQFAAADPSAGSQQVPISCVGADGTRKGANDYVFGFERIYAYADEVNTNPVIERITFDGAPIDPVAGVTMPKCVGDRTKCPKREFDVVVPESSWEDNKGDLDLEGRVLKEQIWVSYFVTHGDLNSDARLLYDSRTGKNTESAIEIIAPEAPASGMIWMVVRDTRGGANWASFPLTFTD